jgi:hypothetical protein
MPMMDFYAITGVWQQGEAVFGTYLINASVYNDDGQPGFEALF